MSRSKTESVPFLLMESAKLLRQAFDRALAAADLGITPAEARLLIHLSATGPLRQAELAERLGIGPMSLSQSVQRLEGAGLVARSPDPDDRRAKMLVLTRKCGPLLDQLETVKSGLRMAMIGTMSDSQWNDLQAGLLALKTNLMNKTRLIARGDGAGSEAA